MKGGRDAEWEMQGTDKQESGDLMERVNEAALEMGHHSRERGGGAGSAHTCLHLPTPAHTCHACPCPHMLDLPTPAYACPHLPTPVHTCHACPYLPALAMSVLPTPALTCPCLACPHPPSPAHVKPAHTCPHLPMSAHASYAGLAFPTVLKALCSPPSLPLSRAIPKHPSERPLPVPWIGELVLEHVLMAQLFSPQPPPSWMSAGQWMQWLSR